MMVPNHVPGKEWLDIFELSSESLTIIKGEGADKVTQTLKILKYEVLP
jgi:hypothetical protein